MKRERGKARACWICGLWLILLFACRLTGVSADVGVPVPMYWQQLDENNHPLEPVSRQMRSYTGGHPQYGPQQCYNGQAWCIRTSVNWRISHYHLDTAVNGDLTDDQKVRADRYCEATYSAATEANRFARTTGVYNCHGYAIGRTDIWVSDINKLNVDDYDAHFTNWPNMQVGVGHLTYEPGNGHSSIISAFSDDPGPHGEPFKKIDKVKQKCAQYGFYETAPAAFAEYGTPKYLWTPKPPRGQAPELPPELSVPTDTEALGGWTTSDPP